MVYTPYSSSSSSSSSSTAGRWVLDSSSYSSTTSSSSGSSSSSRCTTANKTSTQPNQIIKLKMNWKIIGIVLSFLIIGLALSLGLGLIIKWVILDSKLVDSDNKDEPTFMIIKKKSTNQYWSLMQFTFKRGGKEYKRNFWNIKKKHWFGYSYWSTIPYHQSMKLNEATKMVNDMINKAINIDWEGNIQEHGHRLIEANFDPEDNSNHRVCFNKKYGTPTDTCSSRTKEYFLGFGISLTIIAIIVFICVSTGYCYCSDPNSHSRSRSTYGGWIG